MEVQKAATSKIIIDNEKRFQVKKEENETERKNEQKQFQKQLEKNVAVQKDGGAVIIDNTKRLDEIPTNSDDLTIAFLSKGSNL